MGKQDLDESLEGFRKQLRLIDDEILRLMMNRMKIVNDIGALKMSKNMPIYDQAREKFNRERSREVASGSLPEAMIDELCDFLAKWARDIQSQMR